MTRLPKYKPKKLSKFRYDEKAADSNQSTYRLSLVRKEMDKLEFMIKNHKTYLRDEILAQKNCVEKLLANN